MQLVYNHFLPGRIPLCAVMISKAMAFVFSGKSLKLEEAPEKVQPPY
jgi:hypothetical protein